MGFLKDMKKLMNMGKDAQKMAQAANPGGQPPSGGGPDLGSMESLQNYRDQSAQYTQQMSQQNAGFMRGEISNPDDPKWAPINGVTLDQYATLVASMFVQKIDEISMGQFLLENGMDPVLWDTVKKGWDLRMHDDMEVRSRYGIVFSEAQKIVES